MADLLLCTEEQILDHLEDSNGDCGTEAVQINPEVEALKARLKEMEEEAEKIKNINSEMGKFMASGSTGLALSLEEKQQIDSRSVYVGNVDYGSSAEQLESHFHGCGVINRVTILSKGCAYVEFAEQEFAETALSRNESIFRGRHIKVVPKRTNRPGLATPNRFGRGSCRGSCRGSFRGRAPRVSRACCHSMIRGTCRQATRLPGYRGRANYYAPY